MWEHLFLVSCFSSGHFRFKSLRHLESPALMHIPRRRLRFHLLARTTRAKLILAVCERTPKGPPARTFDSTPRCAPTPPLPEHTLPRQTSPRNGRPFKHRPCNRYPGNPPWPWPRLTVDTAAATQQGLESPMRTVQRPELAQHPLVMRIQLVTFNIFAAHLAPIVGEGAQATPLASLPIRHIELTQLRDGLRHCVLF